MHPYTKNHEGKTMSSQQELATIAREIIDANVYMTLATADEIGTPWASPVYYAASDYREFYWVSSPEAQHSRNIAVRTQISIVIFNSQIAIGQGQAVYMAALAEEISGAELERGIDIFSRHSQAHGAPAWSIDDVQTPARHRLYRAVVSQHWILDPTVRGDYRTTVQL
jgi:nitroimidazol reductase NimA-like FMN-containing flavoprotein (pyridoxamine 5'-phosphate oxidase superfamily)